MILSDKTISNEDCSADYESLVVLGIVYQDTRETPMSLKLELNERII